MHISAHSTQHAHVLISAAVTALICLYLEQDSTPMNTQNTPTPWLMVELNSTNYVGFDPDIRNAEEGLAVMTPLRIT
jgi:hypothetical protein